MDKIIVLDFGSQYCHLISRRIREAGVLAEVVPADISAKKLAKDSNIKGIILSGGAQSVFDKKAIKFDKNIFDLKIPILGICYGHQLIAHTLGGEVIEGEAGEYGLTKLDILKPTEVLSKLGKTKKVWMNHRDKVVSLPHGFKVYAETKNSKVAVYGNSSNDIYGVQFHPEVSHTEGGDKIFKNFVFEVCKCEKTRSSKSLVQDIIQEMKDTIGENKAIIGLSGGVDSSVAAMIGSIAIGKQMVAVYVDTGLMRYKETKRLQETFKDSGLDLRVIKAGSKFFKALKGVISPERKRKIIGKLFVDIFSVEAKKEKADFLVQGTIYSDRIESGITKHSSKIKSHHNVGGLPKNLKLKIYEPLRELYKDEVRNIAKEIKLSEKITTQQVFPGPGLGIRIVGEVTPKKTEIVRQASRIVEEELRETGMWKDIWMSFAVLLSIKSVGIQGDGRSYKYPIVVRIIESRDAMTANFSKVPYDVLEKISTRITNEVKDVNRVVYDITHKPPATMEWE